MRENYTTEIINISGVECFEKDGTAYLKLETVARGLGFTRIAASGNEVVRWERVEGYLKELGVPTCGHDKYFFVFCPSSKTHLALERIEMF